MGPEKFREITASISSMFPTPFIGFSCVVFAYLSYMLSSSLGKLMLSEKDSLWLLYGLPISLETLFKKKIDGWLRIVLSIATVILCGGAVWLGSDPREVLLFSIYCLVGIGLLGVIIGAMIVLFTDPLSQKSDSQLMKVVLLCQVSFALILSLDSA